jgi:ATP-dependent Clp protease adaptor protein ClpS
MTTEAEVSTTLKVAQPTLYKVVLLNDDFTTMEFVVRILTDIFGKSEDDAQIIMLQIHKEGRGVVGIYTKQIAEQKIAETHACAQHFGHPLKAISEPA